jgi:SAM-dependent methyltransferase
LYCCPVPATVLNLAPWMAELEARHLADLRFADVSRALRALSSTYVERRERLQERGSLDSAGKRAAFALYYGPRHLQLVRGIVAALPGALAPCRTLVDLGCGTGVAGAAWGSAIVPSPAVTGLDVHPWALGEAAATYRAFALPGEVGRVPAPRARFERVDAVVAAFLVNELEAHDRERLLPRLIQAATRGTRVLVVEPLALRVSPWWPEWVAAFTAAGGRADEWRLALPAPPLVKKLGDAAGLATGEVTGRSLWLGAVQGAVQL